MVCYVACPAVLVWVKAHCGNMIAQALRRSGAQAPRRSQEAARPIGQEQYPYLGWEDAERSGKLKG